MTNSTSQNISTDNSVTDTHSAPGIGELTGLLLAGCSGPTRHTSLRKDS